jgi:prolyl-tRNA synthetase
MRLSKLFGRTQREIPAEADTASHRLMLRAGMVQQLVAGVYSYLPLARRVMDKIENIIRDEMNKVCGQEITMPVLQPIEMWQKTGRDKSFGNGLFTTKDRKERILALGPTHEEVVTDLVGKYVQSYRDLPVMLYQIQTKFRDEPRPRGGLIRVREFTMKDLYSFDADEKGLDESYKKMIQAYKNIYDRCGLSSMMIEADSGAIGGKDSHEFMVITESGEDEVIHCEKCGYAANAEKAECIKEKFSRGESKPLEEVRTPNKQSIEEVAEFLGVEPYRTLKAVFYMADGEFIFVSIRGDLDVNEVKLKNLLKCNELRIARDDEVELTGIVAGSASPIGLKGIRIIADESITTGIGFVVGANKKDYHLKNASYPRDFMVEAVADIALVRAGHKCPKCEGKLISVNGIEVGHVFKLGAFLSKTLGTYYTDIDGNSKPMVMGCYGIGVGRLLAAAIEQSHDDKGIIWPLAIAPFDINLCPLHTEGTEVEQETERLYKELIRQGFEVLLDDRTESPGVKFNDADLLGIPLRVTVSRRTLKDGNVELKWRNQKEAQFVKLEEATIKIKELVLGAQAGV